METLSACILCDSPRLAVACARNAFAKCEECGLVFDNPRPTQAAIVDFYSRHDKYDEWLAEERGRDALWRRRLRRVRRHCPSGKLLDVGTGIGQFLHFAGAHFEVMGTEISTTGVRIARDKYGLELRQGTLETLELDEKFDVITLFHVLEHVPYPRRTLEICKSLLSPGGIVVIAVPNDVDAWLTRRNRFMESRGREKYRHLGKVGLPKLALDGSEIHLSHFTAPVLKTALSRLGFSIVEDSLDPYFSVEGMRKVRRYRRYFTYLAWHQLTGRNLYDTLWLVAKV